MSERKSPWLADKQSKKRMKELYDAEDQLHSLRMAVLNLYNAGIYVNEDMIEEERDKVFDNCALSAGIEFKNGTWILKEGE